MSTAGIDSSSVSQTQVVTALDAELERLFDARVGARLLQRIKYK